MQKTIVSFLLRYFRFWAKFSLTINKPTVIGITGTVGKSSARNVIYAMLKDHVSAKMLEKGNSETGIPLGILGLQVKSLGFQTLIASLVDWLRLFILAPLHIFYLKGTKYLVVEMGIDEPDPPKNMGYLLTIVKPHIAVFLNVNSTHAMQFDKTVPQIITGDERLQAIQRNIAKEKGRILTESGARVGIYNADDPFVSYFVQQEKSHISSLLSFGKSKTNEVSYGTFHINLEQTELQLLYEGKEDLTFNIKRYLLPKEYEEVLAAAIIVGRYIGLSNDQIIQGIERNFSLPEGRSTLLEGIHESVIIDSSYNASPKAVGAFLDLVKDLKRQTKRSVIFLFGDMRELGDSAEIEHTKIAEKIPAVVDYLYCVGQMTKQFVMPLNSKQLKESKWFENSKELGEFVKTHMPENALILVKGSQNTIFLEEAIKPLLKHTEDIKKLCRQSPYWLEVKGIK